MEYVAVLFDSSMVQFHLNIILTSTVLISGGNSGIGKEAALQLAAWGANLVLACRPNPPPREPHPSTVVSECKQAAKQAGHLDSTVECWDIDMSSLSSVSSLAKRYLETGRRLDVLCNNAGLSSTMNRKVITEDGFELIHQVNLLSHILLTLSLLPALAKSDGARILCTTSNLQYLGIFNLANANSGGEHAYPHNKLYFQTWLTEFQVRLSRSTKPEYRRIVCHGVHPGYVKTNIWNPNPSEMAWGEWVLNMLLPYVGISAQQGSLCIVNAATTPSLKYEALREEDGIRGAKFLNRIWEFEPMPQTRHAGCRKMVWDYVSDELKLNERKLLEGI